MKKLTTFAFTLHNANALAIETGQKPIGKRVYSIIAYLTISCALMMTGFGIASPVFARRLSELGAGVEVLSLQLLWAYANRRSRSVRLPVHSWPRSSAAGWSHKASLPWLP